MDAREWWWTGFNNAIDGNYFPPSVTAIRRLAYYIGWRVGKLVRFGGEAR